MKTSTQQFGRTIAILQKACAGTFPLILAITVITGCTRQMKWPPADELDQTIQAFSEIELDEVTARDVEDNFALPVTLEGYEQTQLMSRLEGYVGSVLVDIGDNVQKGQILATLDIPEMAAEMDRQKKMVAKAEANIASQVAAVAQARAKRKAQEALKKLRDTEFTRISTLVKSGALTREKLDEAQFAVNSVEAAVLSTEADVNAALAHEKSAGAELEVAQAELAKAVAMGQYLNIRAPFDGVITERMVDPGAFVRPPSSGNGSMPVLKIESIARLRAVVMLPTDQSRKLDIGDEVELHHIRGLGGQRISGKIARHAHALGRGSRMMRAEIDIENPLDEATKQRRLKPGDYGEATIKLAQYKRAMTVPVKAIANSGNGSYVVSVDSTGRAKHVPVSVLLEQGDIAVVEGDLQIRDRIVARDPDAISDGQELPVK